MNAQKFAVNVNIDKIDETRRIVTGVVYAPNKLDSFGSFMDAETVEKLCYRFMANGLNSAIDTDHDNVLNGCYAVESFIAREGSEYPVGSWVMSVKIDNDRVWERIQKGELNAYSMEIMLLREPVFIQLETDTSQFGEVEPNEDGHTHLFYTKVDPISGKVTGGYTSETNGHTHTISVNSVTDISDNHSHRYILGN